MKKPWTIVIAEDHTLLREGLKLLLSSHPDLEVIGEAGDGCEAIQSVQNYSPDLILMDLSMPRMSGLDAIKEIKGVYPKTKIVVLTAHSAEEYILPTLEAGADGYVLKDTNSAELMKAIRRVLKGHYYISPRIFGTIRRGIFKLKDAPTVRFA